jgi:ATP-dependent exoDNAse (exonuclease V) alpha subunit
MVAAAATLESASIALDHAAWASVEGITVTGPLRPLTATGIAQGSAIHAACSSAAACASAVIEAASRRTFDALAIDRRKNGAELIDRRGQNALDSVRKQIDRATRGQLRRLKVYVGMRGVLTDNKNMKEDFINGTTGVVTAVHLDAHGNAPAVLYFRPDGGATDVRVTPKRTVVTIHGGVGEVERYQFPLLPAHCVTVHRVQGTTVERDLHLLLNREFFAYGQAYVALSRVRRLTQLHLWSLDMAAFSASPRIASEYEKLRMRPLTREYVESARPLRTLGVPPPVAAAALRGGAGKKRVLGA